MPKKPIIHLTWSLAKQVWEIKPEDSNNVLYKSLMKSEAIEKGRELAKLIPAKLIIHKKYSEFDNASFKFKQTSIKK